MKHWSDSGEVVACGVMAPLHSGVKGDRVAPLCQAWATFHTSQVNPAFNSSSLFVLFVGARHAATAMKPWSVERQQWSSGATAVKGGRVAPFVNHAVANQGNKAQLSCTSTL